MWNQINNQADINNLLTEYYEFHDSCICSVDYKSGAKVNKEGSMNGISEECALIVRVERQVPLFHERLDKKMLELKFVGLRRMNLIGYQSNYFCEILSCYLSFYKGLIIWSEDEGFDPESYHDTVLLEEPKSTFVVANRLEWRFV